jgi:hypothetical protein
MWFLAWLLLLIPAGKGAPTAPFPPNRAILVQQDYRIPLRWSIPGKRFRLRVFREGQLWRDEMVDGQEFFLHAQRGVPYKWSVESTIGKAKFESEFILASAFEFRRDGRNGGPGQPGSNGLQIQAELKRDSAGMNLYLRYRQEQYHFLLLEPEVPFVISARGGDGGKGLPGRDETATSYATDGKNGGNAGWGGVVTIRTHDTPWRKYLVIDVSPGQPGEGGSPGYSRDPERSPSSGQSGKPGRPGKIHTQVGP